MDDTIVAISTPIGEGGIGIVRLSGKKALLIADRIFVSKAPQCRDFSGNSSGSRSIVSTKFYVRDRVKPSSFKTYTTHYGHIVRPPKKKPQPTEYGIRNAEYEIIDEVLLTVMRAPKSYTKEDVVEINCHGGIVPLRKILDLVLNLGARLAEPGEFTKRAFLNGRVDLAQAEAVLDIIRSKTDSFMKVAVGQLDGRLSKKINSLKERLLDVLADMETRIDFPEEDAGFKPKEDLYRKLTNVSVEIKKLIDDAWKGIILKEGLMCVICGKPNVGKSSLMNLLLRKKRVIVTPVPGTTRDAIEEAINLRGIPVRVVDTAGISAAKDIVGEHGIRKSKSYIKMADLIIFVLDLSKRWSRIDQEIFDSIREKNVITIANKSDLSRKLNIDKVKKIMSGNKPIEISLLRRKNVEKVEEAIWRRIWHGEVPHPEGALVTNLRHEKSLKRARQHVRKAINALERDWPSAPEIVASDLKEAVFFLGSILGDTVEPDILDRIFSKFCIGK